MSVTVEQIQDVLKSRFGGVLRKGKHSEDGEACALEALSVVRGGPWTDDPSANRTWDLRLINDIDVSDEVRTRHLTPMLAAYAGCMDWPLERQISVASALAIGMVRTLIAELPGLPSDVAALCRAADTLDAARDAAIAASSYATSYAASYATSCAARDATRYASYAASYASYAASSASDAASYAASDAASDAREKVFIAACRVWLDASA